MPRLVWSEAALRDVARLHAFLAPKHPDIARRAVKAIRSGVKELGRHPQIGRAMEGMLPGFREVIVEFGQSAYLVLYRYDGQEVVLLGVRHGREAGYQ